MNDDILKPAQIPFCLVTSPENVSGLEFKAMQALARKNVAQFQRELQLAAYGDKLSSLLKIAILASIVQLAVERQFRFGTTSVADLLFSETPRHKIRYIKLIRQHSDLGLREAKEFVDSEVPKIVDALIGEEGTYQFTI